MTRTHEGWQKLLNQIQPHFNRGIDIVKPLGGQQIQRDTARVFQLGLVLREALFLGGDVLL